MSPADVRHPLGRRSNGSTARARPARQSRREGRPSPRRPVAPRVEPPLLEFRLPDPGDPHWSRELVSRWGARIRLRSCRAMARDGKQLFQVSEISVRPEAMPSVERFMRHRRELLQLSMVRAGPTKLFARTVERASPLCARLIGEGAFCTSCRFLAGTSPGTPPWTVVLPKGPAARGILRSFGPPDGTAGREVVPLRPFRPSKGMTERQSRALGTAQGLGYYAFPRKGRLSDVSRSLGVSRSTAAELLRRAEAKVVTDSLAG